MKIKIVLGFAIIGFLFSTFIGTAALDCYTCTNATYVSACNSKSTCNAGEICFSDHVLTPEGMLYSFGCRTSRECKSIIAANSSSSVVSGSLIGRSVVAESCSECCKEQYCNRNLCQHTFPEKSCADSSEIHCAAAGVIVDICSDIDKASKLCRRFCGLCNYVNGQWSSWFSWSNCHVTCGIGTQSRARNCSEPPPSGGGHVCVGHSQETGKCTLEPCPIHGSWADWTPWGSCSASCGIGLQRRNRSCSNPYPSRFGDHCFGDAQDDNICLSRACQDGGWADWSSWGTCSRTCGDGIHTRSRTCDNPLPSIQGNYCQGDPYQVETCSLRNCPETSGGWGTWSEWTHCSATCNTGMKSRLRDCDKPAPSSGGTHCQGSPYDVHHCIIKSCPKYCPVNWFFFQESCYNRSTKALEWLEAEEDCIALGGHLVEITSEEENNFITSNMSLENHVWIGLNDNVTEGVYVWVSSGKNAYGVYTKWAPDEPSDKTANENCVTIVYNTGAWDPKYKTGTWNDVRCSAVLHYICEKKSM